MPHPRFRAVRRQAGALLLLLSVAAAPVGAQAGAPAAPAGEALRDDEALFHDAIQGSWMYLDGQYQPSTGLINSVLGYPYATMWDIGSSLAALFCAYELGLLSEAQYEHRMRLALRTLREMRLFDDAAYNKFYSTRTGAMQGRNNRGDSQRGYGWSATDLGRLLVWLKIVAVNHPQFAHRVDHLVARMDLSRVVHDGYLWGRDEARSGRARDYMEGRIPYEQYAAAGFALWGHRAEQALSLHTNSLPITVLEVPLVADRRGHDHLTSEPLILQGMELGWSEEMRELAEQLLRVQEERYRRTGQVTVLSEDAIPRAPYYFYYYTPNLHGTQFAVTVQGSRRVLDEPRWVSAKAAYAWHALRPGDYTRLAVETVAPARHPERGWSSGVYERSGRATGSENINTAAVILEAALYRRWGRPLIEGEPPPRPEERVRGLPFPTPLRASLR